MSDVNRPVPIPRFVLSPRGWIQRRYEALLAEKEERIATLERELAVAQRQRDERHFVCEAHMPLDEPWNHDAQCPCCEAMNAAKDRDADRAKIETLERELNGILPCGHEQRYLMRGQFAECYRCTTERLERELEAMTAEKIETLRCWDIDMKYIHKLRAELRDRDADRAAIRWLLSQPSGPGEGMVSEPEDCTRYEAWLAEAPQHAAAIARATQEPR